MGYIIAGVGVLLFVGATIAGVIETIIIAIKERRARLRGDQEAWTYWLIYADQSWWSRLTVYLICVGFVLCMISGAILDVI